MTITLDFHMREPYFLCPRHPIASGEEGGGGGVVLVGVEEGGGLCWWEWRGRGGGAGGSGGGRVSKHIYIGRTELIRIAY